ncbi:MAG: hypothetical protein EKK45_01860 [Curvibacter sp.]|nr:MAG: hypothetical protein EKK45_01860 [Curvibacter sp.]
MILNSGTGKEAVQAKQATEERIKSGSPAPTPPPKRLPLDQIILIPEVFQPRSGGSQAYRSEAHVNTLARSLTNARAANPNARTAPVLVFWVGDAWACLDGHHRLEALRQNARRGTVKGGTVAVEVFEGTVADAMREATRRNSQDKLTMTAQDKSERAWQLLLTKAGTHRQIAEDTGVTERTLTRMAKVIRDHGATPEKLEMVQGLRWWQAKKLDAGAEDQDVDARAAKVQRKAEVYGKVMKDDHPDLVAEVLMHLDPEKAKAVARRLALLLTKLDPYGDDIGLPEFPPDEVAEGEQPDF